ncbi:hypothetical protein ACILD6_10485 [Capnocytophaga canimorsus]|uniref:Uncharacterized protein n=1 Tax=Capnocytophaga canimorsus TaxID=28188 RepID=A0A0B7IH71_9FLAO|nr:hypothetical protein [Capnocytophaga canimorsus]CEN49313.1 conserved hypothetical protein [Capnocytophaga canimorsus]
MSQKDLEKAFQLIEDKIENGELAYHDIECRIFDFLFCEEENPSPFYEKGLEEMFAFYFAHNNPFFLDDVKGRRVVDTYNFLCSMLRNRELLVKIATDKNI